jgi:hypothetical protein
MSLDDVSVGDKLIRYDNRIDRKVVVCESFSKTQVTCGNERFIKFSGRRVGDADSWGRAYVRFPKNGEVDEVEALNRILAAWKYIRAKVPNDFPSAARCLGWKE